jgi:HK97 gp10 family phage protein
MVVKVNFKFEGGKEIAAAMKELGVSASGRIVRSALNRSANVVTKRAKELVPVDSGELRRAIAKRLRRARRGSDKQTVLVGIERPTSRRAHFAEFGTSRSAAHPFLRPSLDESAAEVLRVQQEAMRAGLEREVAKLAQKHKTRKR